MGRFLAGSIQLCLLACLIIVSYCEADTSRGPKRTKVSPYAGLVPFLRTGRSRLDLSLPESENDEVYKRAKPGRTTIMAFPRVGRSGTSWDREEARNGQKKSSTANNGLWFGPRLGRIHKRQEYKQDFPFAYLYIGDYTPRLGRESEELLDDKDALSEDQETDKAVLEAV